MGLPFKRASRENGVKPNRQGSGKRDPIDAVWGKLRGHDGQLRSLEDRLELLERWKSREAVRQSRTKKELETAEPERELREGMPVRWPRS